MKGIWNVLLVCWIMVLIACGLGFALWYVLTKYVEKMMYKLVPSKKEQITNKTTHKKMESYENADSGTQI